MKTIEREALRAVTLAGLDALTAGPAQLPVARAQLWDALVRLAAVLSEQECEPETSVAPRRT